MSRVCVSVALFTQHAERMRRVMLWPVACLVLPHFFHIIAQNDTVFGKNDNEYITCVFSFSVLISFWNISRFKNTWATYEQNCTSVCTDTVARHISHFDTVTVMLLSVLLYFKTSKRNIVLVHETPRCRLQHDLIWGQMKRRLHESKVKTTLLERRDLSKFWVVLTSLTGSPAASRVVWILLKEHLKLRCTFGLILAVANARVVTHIVPRICCVVFRVETIRNCESRMRLLSCAVLFCPPFSLPCSCPSCGPEIA